MIDNWNTAVCGGDPYTFTINSFLMNDFHHNKTEKSNSERQQIWGGSNKAGKPKVTINFFVCTDYDVE